MPCFAPLHFRGAVVKCKLLKALLLAGLDPRSPLLVDFSSQLVEWSSTAPLWSSTVSSTAPLLHCGAKVGWNNFTCRQICILRRFSTFTVSGRCQIRSNCFEHYHYHHHQHHHHHHHQRHNHHHHHHHNHHHHQDQNNDHFTMMIHKCIVGCLSGMFSIERRDFNNPLQCCYIDFATTNN